MYISKVVRQFINCSTQQKISRHTDEWRSEMYHHLIQEKLYDKFGFCYKFNATTQKHIIPFTYLSANCLLIRVKHHTSRGSEHPSTWTCQLLTKLWTQGGPKFWRYGHHRWERSRGQCQSHGRRRPLPVNNQYSADEQQGCVHLFEPYYKRLGRRRGTARRPVSMSFTGVKMLQAQPQSGKINESIWQFTVGTAMADLCLHP